MTDAIRFFLSGVNIFFFVYLIGYSTFLFFSVVVGASRLYSDKEQELLHNKLWQNYHVPVSILVPAYNEEVTVVAAGGYDAICWSQAPERLGDLSKQRKRWQRGLFQSMWGHREMMANPRYGLVDTVSYLYFLLYELLSPYIEVFGMATILLSIAVDMLNVRYMAIYFVVYAFYGGLLSLTAFFSRIHTLDMRLSFRDLCRAMLLCLFETTFLRFYLAVVRATAFVGYKKNKLNWDKLARQKLNQEAEVP